MTITFETAVGSAVFTFCECRYFSNMQAVCVLLKLNDTLSLGKFSVCANYRTFYVIVSVLVYFLPVSSHAYSYSVYSQLLNDQQRISSHLDFHYHIFPAFVFICRNGTLGEERCINITVEDLTTHRSMFFLKYTCRHQSNITELIY